MIMVSLIPFADAPKRPSPGCAGHRLANARELPCSPAQALGLLARSLRRSPAAGEMGAGDAARCGYEAPGPPRTEGRPLLLHPAPLSADSRQQEGRSRHQLTRSLEMPGGGGAHHRADVADARRAD